MLINLIFELWLVSWQQQKNFKKQEMGCFSIYIYIFFAGCFYIILTMFKQPILNNKLFFIYI